MSDVPRGLRTWVAGGLCALAVSASVYSLAPLIQPGRWFTVAVASVTVLAALLAGVRALTRSWWAPTLVGLVATVFGILAAYASPPGRFQALPNGASLGRLGDTLRAGLAYVDAARPPAQESPELELLVVGGALLVLLLVDLVALGLAAPAWSGLVLLALWLPAIALEKTVSVWAFIGTAAGYLVLLALTAAPAPGSRGSRGRRDASRRTGAAVAGAATVTVAAIVLGPVSVAAPGFASIRVPDFGSVSAGSLRLAQDLDLRDSLGARSNEVELTYRADPVTVGPLRVFTLRDFDGENWSRDDRPSSIAADDALLWPARDLANRPAQEAKPIVSEVTVRIAGLQEERLPVPVMPRTVDAQDWTYDAERDEVVRGSTTGPGLEYSIRTELLDISAQTLRAAPTDFPADLDQYLAVPQTSRTGDVTATAAEVTAGLTNHYDQALALQSYLRNTQNFTYSTEVPAGQSDDAVWDFLGSKIGYCVQFGTAMTVMARTLGIPARLAVGFLPGSLADSGEQVVTGRDSHAWPELYFPDSGWIRFEPTPAIQSGAPPRWADPFAGAGVAPVPEPNPRAQGVTPSASPTVAPQAAAPTATAQTSRGLAIGIGSLVTVVAIGLLTWLARRRRPAGTNEPGSEVAWGHLRTRLAAAGITWSDARTPRQVVDLVTAELERRNGSAMRTEAQAALRDLALAVEDVRYAPNPHARDRSELENLVTIVLREITAPVPVTVPSN
ncbi:transglutaminaseTgpA domain-containing protein [Pengzhenrongella phosphoraccumulans]|uniref:transglutaminase family protein n=1 Tax=Pengzhenrongella phosphoraccumulans TaxID=3114394 RepID=UPI00388FB871